MANIKRFDEFSANMDMGHQSKPVSEDFITKDEQTDISGIKNMDSEQIAELRDRTQEKLDRLASSQSDGAEWDHVQDEIETCIDTIEACDKALKNPTGTTEATELDDEPVLDDDDVEGNGEIETSESSESSDDDDDESDDDESDESDDDDVKSAYVDGHEPENAPEAKDIEVEYSHSDDNGLEFYKNEKGQLFCEVDGRWHTATSDWNEPEYAIRNKIIIKGSPTEEVAREEIGEERHSISRFENFK